MVEVQWLEKLEHNTLVQHNFISGTILSIPDPESEPKQETITMKTQVIKMPSKKKIINDPNAKMRSHSEYKPNHAKKVISNKQLMNPETITMESQLTKMKVKRKFVNDLNTNTSSDSGPKLKM